VHELQCLDGRFVGKRALVFKEAGEFLCDGKDVGLNADSWSGEVVVIFLNVHSSEVDVSFDFLDEKDE